MASRSYGFVCLRLYQLALDTSVHTDPEAHNFIWAAHTAGNIAFGAYTRGEDLTWFHRDISDHLDEFSCLADWFQEQHDQDGVR